MRRKIALGAGMLALLLMPSGAAAAATLDQAQEQVGHAAGFPEDIVPIQALAQTFTAGRSGTLSEVWIYPTGNGLGKRSVTVELRETSSGLPGTSVLASASVKTNLVGKWIKVSFRPGAADTAGTQYAIVTVMNGSKGVVLEGHWGNPYAGGDAYATTDNGWSRFEDIYSGDIFDFAFRTYVQ